MNEALLNKILWRLHTDPTNLWAKVLISKYGRKWNFKEKLIVKKGDSRLWKELAKLWDGFNQNIQRLGAKEETELIWKLTSHGEFTTASAYQGLINDMNVQEKLTWKRVWKLKTTERIRVVVWRCLHNKIPTKSITRKWGGGGGMCPICNQSVEDLIHALRDCPAVTMLWRKLVLMERRIEFFGSEWWDWIDLNLEYRGKGGDEAFWPELFATCCWKIWTWRNKRMKDENANFPEHADIEVRKHVADYFHRWDNEACHKKAEMESMIRWKKPQQGWCKLNTNGMVTVEGVAGCDGLIRGDEGEWLHGFTCKLSTTNSLTAEAWGVFKGLEACWNKGFRKVEVECDALQVIQFISNQRHRVLRAEPWVGIKKLIEQEWQVVFLHNVREGNRCTDALADLSKFQRNQIANWDEPPEEITRLLQEDQEGAGVPRVLSVTM